MKSYSEQMEEQLEPRPERKHAHVFQRSEFWPESTAHHTYWEQHNCAFVYEYDPADDGPEVEILPQIRANNISDLRQVADAYLTIGAAYLIFMRAYPCE